MKILILSPTPGLYKSQTQGGGYNGGGWIAALQQMLACTEGVEIALSFVTGESAPATVVQDGCRYYPVHTPAMGAMQKIRYYHGGYRNADPDRYNERIREIVADFQPDIIYLFGLENKLASVLMVDVGVPVLAHLQGLLAPSANAYLPPAINEHTFMHPMSKREWIIKNGYVFGKRQLDVRAEREQTLVKHLRYAAGRTAWDHNYVRLLQPDIKYFHIDEILRDTFYDHSASWQRPAANRHVIVSTISDTVYKGLDLIIKTAKILKDTGLDFEWHIAGVKSDTAIVRFFERALAIDSAAVNIVYDGVRTPIQLVEMLTSASAYVHPSYIDNSPNSLCEAQLIGCPVIGTYVGGIPSLIDDGVTGLLTPANDPWSLAGHIRDLCTDADLAMRLSAQGSAAAAARHRPQTIVNAVLDACRAVIADNSNRPISK